MLKFTENKATKWEITRKSKTKYIVQRALLYGSVFVIGLNLSSAIYGDSSFLQTILLFLIYLIISTLTIGLLSAFGDWKINEYYYKEYLQKNKPNNKLNPQLSE